MSGGSWDYLCYKVQDAAYDLRKSGCPQRRAFGKHLILVADALHDIEWVDSSDKGPGDEIEAIMKCIAVMDVIDVTCEDAKKMIGELDKLVKAYEAKGG